MKINEYIDHTNLKAFASVDDIRRLCDEAIKYKFMSVCVNPYYVGLCNEMLSRSEVKVCTVVGFPLGQNTISTKIFETKEALENGADEIDMVINISALKDKNYDYVKEEITELRKVCKDKILKVIIEVCYLSDDEIKIMTEICNECNVDFIKTSTGFGTGGATLNSLQIMNKYKNDKLEIKASGGIKSYEDAINCINNGATRIGTSNGIKIMENK